MVAETLRFSVLMTRLVDWENRLRTLVDEWTASKYRPGIVDCGRFAARWVEAITGVYHDPVGEYYEIREGMAKLNALGFDDHVEYAKSLYPTDHWSTARVGDLAILPGRDGGLTLGGVWGARVYVVDDECLCTVDLALAKSVLRIN